MNKEIENLTNKEIGLLEEMKKNCLGNEYQVYKDKKAKDKFYLLCHLEDFCIKCYDLQQENKQLKEEKIALMID